MSMGNPFEVKCNLCDLRDDLRKMKQFNGNYYHNVRTQGKVTCLQAAKDARRGK